MNCAECKELLIGYVEGLLTESQKQEIELHLKSCSVCQAELEELNELRNRLVANGKVLAESDLEEKVLGRILQEQSLKLREASKFNKQLQLWRKIMKSRISKLAAAAVIIVVAVMTLTFWERTVPTAYGLEQTIQANHTVQYLHIMDFKAGEDEPKEFWIEFSVDGQVKNVRMHMPEWDSPEDGAKVVVWKENKAQLWLKKKNIFATIRDKTVAAHMLKFVEELDPRLAVARLYEREEQGKVTIDINEPSDKAEPIVVTATYLPETPTPNRRFVLFVDQSTKLVTAMETYQLKDGEYKYVGMMEYYDYNQPIDAKMFTLEQVPDDAMRVDQTTQEIGLAQGNLTDEEIAVKVVREFLEAVIAKDYATASKLYQGVPAEFLQKQL
ncbi:MAG: anti-sigma factor family protein, partial [Planctomycetota bacterium]